MKKLVTLLVMACAAVAYAADAKMSLADAKARIGDIIQSKTNALTGVMKELSAEDQAAFLQAVNATIAELPASTEEKTTKYVALDRQALEGAAQGNLAALVAEVFATVPPESLTVVNERFASELFNRAADVEHTYTDEQFTDLAKSTLAKVNERCEKEDNSSVRETFAILMMLRASNGTPENLADTLVAMLPSAEARGMAKDGWINPAMGKGQEKTYDPLLGVSGQGSAPDLTTVFTLLGPEAVNAVLADLDANSTAFRKGASPMASDALPRFAEDAGLERVPRTMNPNAPYNPKYTRDEPHAPYAPYVPHREEPKPYRWQNF